MADETIEIIESAPTVKNMVYSLHTKLANIQGALGRILKVREAYVQKSKIDSKDVHYVIVCNEVQLNSTELNVFLKNIHNVGVLLEITPGIVYKKLFFIKLQIPETILIKFANIYNIHFHYQREYRYNPPRFILINKMKVDALDINSQRNIYTRIPDLFELEKNVTEAERILVLYKMLEKTYYGNKFYAYGIQSLQDNHFIMTHYPLHDGSYKMETYGPLCYRQVLHEYWSRSKRIFKAQPLDTIERYYGAEVGLYFAWFGFYISMLTISALFGVIFFVIAIFLYPSESVYIDEICESDAILCPVCYSDDNECQQVVLKKYCSYTQASYFFDNPCTVLFAIFMSFWCTVYYEFWKRKEAKLKLKWNLMFVETDFMTRVEFARQTQRRRISDVTGEIEPYVPLIVKLYRYTISVTICLFIILMVITSVLLVIIYRVTITRAMLEVSNINLQHYSHFISGLTSALITVIIIKLFTLIYGRIAQYLTDIELHRTQVEYENAYIYKLWIISFVNYYLPLIYIAFIKGRFFRYPGDETNSIIWRDLQMDVCPLGCCLMSLSIQIFIILSIKEVSVKLLAHLIMVFRLRMKERKLPQKTKTALDDETLPQWEKDYALIPNKEIFLIPDYMEIMLQYGLVTFFVAACPLAPLVVLIYNVAEIRLDATKFTKYYRRPVPKRLPGIGAWSGIIQMITILGTIANAFVIGFTSDIVPREIHRVLKGTLSGFMNSSLSVSSYMEDGKSAPCYYRGLRYPADHPQKYAHKEEFWLETVVRLIVVIIFENFVLGLAAILAYAIPDIPFAVKAQMSYEREKRKKQEES